LVLFESTASDLVANDTNGCTDVFLRNLSDGTTTLISAATNGVPANGESRSCTMTTDGRYVAFVSAGTNLIVRGDTNRISDVYVRDLLAGTTILVSTGAVSTTQIGSSEAPDISADGRYVAFYSSASNLVSGMDTRFDSDIYIRDLQSNRTTLASGYARIALPLNRGACFNHNFSADGHFLVYEVSGNTALFGTVLRYNIDSGLTDVVETNAAVPRASFEDIRSLDINADGRFISYVANHYTTDGSTTCIRLWDAQTGTSTIVSGNLSNAGVEPGSFCDWPCLDASGQYVAFLSSATNLVTNSVLAGAHLYLHDVQMSRRTLIDANRDGASGNISPSVAPQLTPDARFVAFEADDAALLPADSNHDTDVFFQDLQNDRLEMISAHDPGLPSVTPNGHCSITVNSISADGRFVAFASEADNLLAEDTNGFRDIFVADLADGSIRLASANTNGLAADGVSSEPSISEDGRFVAFTSMADDLVPRDTNHWSDVFVRDVQLGITRLVSMNRTGVGPGAGASYMPAISSDGRFVLFRSLSHDLAPGSFNNENLYLRDLQLGTNFALTTLGMAGSSMTPDGRFVAVVDLSGASSGTYYLWDSLGQTRSTNVLSLPLTNITISPDGHLVAYTAGSGSASDLYLRDNQTGNTRLIVNGPGPWASFNFSAGSQALVYCRKIAPARQVFYYGVQIGSNVLVSTRLGSALEANNDSDSPAISPDGRFIVYRSAATDIVAADNNGQPDLILYDRQTGQNLALSSTSMGGTTADNRSLLPVFSRDGSRLLFATWASDITSGDFNHSSDLFTYTFLNALILAASSGPEGPTISWPWLEGKNYTVEYKNSLSDQNWQPAAGVVNHVGVKGFLQDPSPAAGQRFYRVKCF
jgi:Tol biopolymer transport system component